MPLGWDVVTELVVTCGAEVLCDVDTVVADDGVPAVEDAGGVDVTDVAEAPVERVVPCEEDVPVV